MRWQDYLILATSMVALASGLHSASKPSGTNPVEVGNVRWERDYDTAVSLAKKSNKPIFALFQEVPG